MSITSSYGAFYYPPTENLPQFDVLVFRNAQDVTSYATNAGNINITNTTSGTTYYPTFVDKSSGYAMLRTYAADLGYDATNKRLKITGITPNNGQSIDLNGTPIGNGGNFSSIAMGVGAGQTNGTMPNNCFCFGGNSGKFLTTGGVQNLFIGSNSGNLVTTGRSNTFLGASAGRKTTTGTYNTQIGAQSQSYPDENFTGSYNLTIGAESYISTDGLSYSTAIGAGVVASTSNTVRIGRSIDTTIFDGVVTNTVTQPASSDSSTKVPTTAWVQSAITAGALTNATTLDLTLDSTNGVYWVPFSKTDNPTSNTIYIDSNPNFLGYNPNTGTLVSSNFNGTLNGSYNLIDITTAATDGAIYADNGIFTYDNNINSGSHLFAVNDAGGIQSTPLKIDSASIKCEKPISLTSTVSTSRTINNTFYNLNDTTAVAGGANQARIYSSATATFIEAFVGNHPIYGVENSTVSSRQLFKFAVDDANMYSPNITIGGTSNINFGQGAGSLSNLICGYLTPRSIVFTTGSNTIIGSQAGQNANISAGYNTLIGNSSGSGITSGARNSFLGYNTGFLGAAAGTGNQNTIVGYSAGSQMINAASDNTYVGNGSGTGTTTGTQNTFVGSLSGFQTGAAGTGSNNVCIGYAAGDSLTTTANSNTLIGTSAGHALTTGNSNTMMGYNTGIGTTTGTQNTFIGGLSGFQTPASPGTSGNNVCVGYLSGAALIGSANSNTFIGTSAGNIVTSGLNNICIGFNSAPLTATTSNSITIGTVTETMFIKGGFNWRVGTQITNTATGNLATSVLAQFYTVAMTAASQTITLPNPTGAAYLGARVTFKRKTNTTVFTITSTGGAGFLPIGSITLTASPISIAATVFQVDLVNDGTNWCIIGQA